MIVTIVMDKTIITFEMEALNSNLNYKYRKVVKQLEKL
jgi:hypothetical protein